MDRTLYGPVDDARKVLNIALRVAVEESWNMAMQATREMRPDGKVRLPPGQHLTTGWPVLHYGSIPRIDLASWKFHVWGLGEEEKSFTWDAFNDIHCVTTWSKYDNTWEGVPFKALLDQVKVKPEAKYAMLHSYGGYTTN